MDKILTPNELCDYMKISQRTLYRMLNKGKLPFAMKIDGSWRFFEKDVDKYLEQSKIHAKILNVLNTCIEELVENKKKSEPWKTII